MSNQENFQRSVAVMPYVTEAYIVLPSGKETLREKCE